MKCLDCGRVFEGKPWMKRCEPCWVAHTRQEDEAGTTTATFVFEDPAGRSRLLLDFGLPDCALGIGVSYIAGGDDLVATPWLKLKTVEEVAALARPLVAHLIDADWPGEVVERWQGLNDWLEHLHREFFETHGYDHSGGEAA